MRLQQPIKEYKILIETHPSGLLTSRLKTLWFTGTKAEAQNHLTTYLKSHNLSVHKAYLQEVL